MAVTQLLYDCLLANFHINYGTMATNKKKHYSWPWKRRSTSPFTKVIISGYYTADINQTYDAIGADNESVISADQQSVGEGRIS